MMRSTGMKVSRGQRFWNRFADRYAARQIKDGAAYEALLADAAARLEPGDTVLELGCGTGATAIRLAGGVAHYTATDYAQEMIRIAKAKPAPATLGFVVADAGRVCEGSPFDVICAFNVLHLVDDLPGVLASIHQQLKPGGLLISKTWCFADMRWKLRFLFTGLRIIGLFPSAQRLSVSHLRQKFADAGFDIVDERIFGRYPQNPYIVARRRPESRPSSRFSSGW